MISLDGSVGYGGGQILRTALAFAGHQGVSIEVYNIRVDRQPPGLSAQHLAVVRAVADLCGGRVQGDELRSTHVVFKPAHSPVAGDHTVDVAAHIDGDSAGSVTLVVQALIWPLLVADGSSTLTVRGGTHVRWSPPAEYLQDVYLPRLRKLGIEATLDVEKCGFFPEGGGCITLQVAGQGSNVEIRPYRGHERGDLYTVDGRSAVANLPDHIRRRQADQAKAVLETAGIPVRMERTEPPTDGRGTYVYLHAAYEHAHAGFVAYGEPGNPAEEVAREAANELVQFHRTGAPVQNELGDQLLLPLTLADGFSSFEVAGVTDHLKTLIQVLEQLTARSINISRSSSGNALKEIRIR